MAARLLDAGATGPRRLLRPAVAECVLQVLLTGEANGQHELGAWVLMPNHVRIVFERQPEVSQM